MIQFNDAYCQKKEKKEKKFEYPYKQISDEFEASKLIIIGLEFTLLPRQIISIMDYVFVKERYGFSQMVSYVNAIIVCPYLL